MLASTDGIIASISRIRGCYASYGIIITIVSYLWYLYLVVEKNVLHEIGEKKKKSVFPCVMYVHTEYTRHTATFIACQLRLQSDNGEMMFLLVAISRSG